MDLRNGTVRLTAARSMLVRVRPAVRHFTEVLTDILRLRIRVISRGLYHITKANTCKGFLNHRLDNGSHLLHRILRAGARGIIARSHFSPLYRNYSDGRGYHRGTFLNAPIVLRSHYIKIVDLVTIARRRRRRVDSGLHRFSSCIHRVSAVFISGLLRSRKPKSGVDGVFTAVVSGVSRNMLIISSRDQIRFIGRATLGALNIMRGGVVKGPVHFEPLAFRDGFARKRVRRVIS